MKNKILLVGLFCCSLVSTEAQVLLDKNAGKNSFPIVSPAANVVVCFDGKDETVVRKSVTLFADDVRRVLFRSAFFIIVSAFFLGLRILHFSVNAALFFA